MTQSEDPLALEIKAEFTRLKRVKSPYYNPAAKNEVHFERAADLARKMEVSARDYLRALTLSVGVDKMFPNSLYPKWLQEKYTTSNISAQHQVTSIELLPVYMKVLRDAVLLREMSVEEALMNDNLQLPAWYRICVTKELNLEVHTKYLEKALTELDAGVIAAIESAGMNIERLEYPYGER